MTQAALRPIDHSGLKVGTGSTLILLVSAFLLDNAFIVALVALCQLCAALMLPFAPYRVLYTYVVRPRGWLKLNVIQDNPRPHQFAMMIGTLFNGAAAILLLNGFVWAWLIVGVVFLLANMQFWLNFCAGCWLYYQLTGRMKRKQ